MQCPACNKESDPAEYGDPAKCPACGVFYEKALALKQRRLAAEVAAAEEAAKAKPSGANKLADGRNGAKVSVEDARRQDETEHQRNISRGAAEQAKPVVVVDVNISFGSMVMLLVKLAFAAIPAAIIVAILVWGFVSIFSVLSLVT